MGQFSVGRTFTVGPNGLGGMWADGRVHPWAELTGGKSISLWNWYVGSDGLSCAKAEGQGAILVPIKNAQPNTGDADGDLISDYADGLSDKFADKGLRGSSLPTKSDGTPVAESALFVEIMKVPQGSGGTIRVDYHGDASPPSLMQYDASADPPFVPLPNQGKMRVWTKNGDELRDSRPVSQGGDFVPHGSDVSAGSLAGKTLYLEVLKVSEEEGDLRVTVTKNHETEAFSIPHAFTSVSTDFHAVLENGSTERLNGMASSLPSPEITINHFQVTGTRPNEDGSGLLANLSVSGTVRSAVCDITPGEEGKIDEIHASVNSEPSPDRSVSVSVNKSRNQSDLRRPYPYAGSFTRTFTDIPVVEGNNVFSLLATDPVYRLPGSVAIPFTIEAAPPAGVLTERSLTIEFPKPENNLASGTVRVTYTRDGVSTIEAVVLSSVSATRYEQASGGIAIELGSAPALNPELAEMISATILDGGSAWGSDHFPILGEFAADSFAFGASNGGSVSTSYEGWDVSLGEIAETQSQGAGEFNPMVIKMSGPERLLDTLKEVEIGDVTVPVIKKNGSYFLAREDDKNQVATIIVSPIRPDVGDDLGQLGSSTPDWENLPEDVPEAELDAALNLIKRKDPDWDKLAERLTRGGLLFGSANVTDKADLKYYKGLFDGFKGNPSDTISELWGLAKGAVKLGAKAIQYSPGLITFKVAWEFTGGDRFEGEMKAEAAFRAKITNTAHTYWPQVREFLYTLEEKTDAEIAEFLATGRFPGSEKIGPAMELAMFTVLNLYVSAMDWWNGLEPYKRGYYQGYILFEVVAAVVSGLLTAPAGGSGAAVILARHAPKFGMVLKKLGAGLTRLANAAGDSLGPLRNVIDDLLTRITGAKAGGWCFVAGTMIMTAQGAVPIEQIREGDLVWSAHEETGKVGLAPVMELYRNEAEEIWTVLYAGSEDGAPMRELKCTGEHPFWSETEQSFVPASQLKPGGELRLFGGESARVVSVTPRRGPPGERTRVYNFAVAGHHTYYAGEDGVWVHNTCEELLEDIVALNKTHLDEIGDHDEAARKALEAIKFDTYKGKKITNPNRTPTASQVFENNPNVVAGSVADDTNLAARFSQEAGLPNDKPVSVARLGDGEQPYFGTPDSISPTEWKDMSKDLSANLWVGENPPLAIRRAQAVAHHSESKALLRMGEKTDLLGKQIELATANVPVCGGCINQSGSGLAEIVKHLGIKRLRLRSSEGFEDPFFDGLSGVTIKYDEISDTVDVIPGLVD